MPLWLAWFDHRSGRRMDTTLAGVVLASTRPARLTPSWMLAAPSAGSAARRAEGAEWRLFLGHLRDQGWGKLATALRFGCGSGIVDGVGGFETGNGRRGGRRGTGG